MFMPTHFNTELQRDVFENIVDIAATGRSNTKNI
jgi:hypothetical protein